MLLLLLVEEVCLEGEVLVGVLEFLQLGLQSAHLGAVAVELELESLVLCFELSHFEPESLDLSLQPEGLAFVVRNPDAARGGRRPGEVSEAFRVGVQVGGLGERRSAEESG